MLLFDTSWYDAAAAEFTISTPTQLAGLAAITSPANDYDAWQAGGRSSRAEGIAQDNFAGKTVRLASDLDMGGKLDPQKRFDPVSDMNNWGGGGQGTSNGTYKEVAWQGTFDGQNHTIANVYLAARVRRPATGA